MQQYKHWQNAVRTLTGCVIAVETNMQQLPLNSENAFDEQFRPLPLNVMQKL